MAGPIATPPSTLLVATTLDVGGAERVLERVARGLQEAGALVEVASLLPPGPIGAALARAGIRVHALAGPERALPAPQAAHEAWTAANAPDRPSRASQGPSRGDPCPPPSGEGPGVANARPRPLSWRGAAAIPWALARLLDRRRFDVVGSLLFHANQAVRLARFLAWAHGIRPPPHVASVRVTEEARPWRQTIERALASASARVVCVSADARAALCLARSRRCVVIRNGVPVPASPAPLWPGAPWLCVGRVDPQKGQDVLLEAWRLLGSEAPRLRLAGRIPAGAHGDAVRTVAGSLGADLLGEREDVPALLEPSGGFVLASRYEGVPNALLEAMAAGLPIVASDLPGVREVLAPGREGLLVPVGDARALADAVRRIIRDPALAASLGRAARARVIAEHAVERMVSRWIGVLSAAAAEA